MRVCVGQILGAHGLRGLVKLASFTVEPEAVISYGSLTDASGTEMVDITQENGRQTRNLRMALLILNYGHNNEIYGSIVTSMRIKGIVPPASEPRPRPTP